MHIIRYVGQFAHGQRHGRGTLSYADGTKYTGDFANNVKHGEVSQAASQPASLSPASCTRSGSLP